MSTAGLPTIWELVAEGAATLPEPFSRAALLNWVRARRPDVGAASIAAHIQLATDNAGHPPSGRAPLLHRVDRGLYVRHREGHRDEDVAAVASGRLVLIGSSGATTADPAPSTLAPRARCRTRRLATEGIRRSATDVTTREYASSASSSSRGDPSSTPPLYRRSCGTMARRVPGRRRRRIRWGPVLPTVRR